MPPFEQLGSSSLVSIEDELNRSYALDVSFFRDVFSSDVFDVLNKSLEKKLSLLSDPQHQLISVLFSSSQKNILGDTPDVSSKALFYRSFVSWVGDSSFSDATFDKETFQGYYALFEKNYTNDLLAASEKESVSILHSLSQLRGDHVDFFDSLSDNEGFNDFVASYGGDFDKELSGNLNRKDYLSAVYFLEQVKFGHISVSSEQYEELMSIDEILRQFELENGIERPVLVQEWKSPRDVEASDFSNLASLSGLPTTAMLTKEESLYLEYEERADVLMGGEENYIGKLLSHMENVLDMYDSSGVLEFFDGDIRLNESLVSRLLAPYSPMTELEKNGWVCHRLMKYQQQHPDHVLSDSQLKWLYDHKHLREYAVRSVGKVLYKDRKKVLSDTVIPEYSKHLGDVFVGGEAFSFAYEDIAYNAGGFDVLCSVAGRDKEEHLRFDDDTISGPSLLMKDMWQDDRLGYSGKHTIMDSGVPSLYDFMKKAAGMDLFDQLFSYAQEHPQKDPRGLLMHKQATTVRQKMTALFGDKEKTHMKKKLEPYMRVQESAVVAIDLLLEEIRDSDGNVLSDSKKEMLRSSFFEGSEDIDSLLYPDLFRTSQLIIRTWTKFRDNPSAIVSFTHRLKRLYQVLGDVTVAEEADISDPLVRAYFYPQGRGLISDVENNQKRLPLTLLFRSFCFPHQDVLDIRRMDHFIHYLEKEDWGNSGRGQVFSSVNVFREKFTSLYEEDELLSLEKEMNEDSDIVV